MLHIGSDDVRRPRVCVCVWKMYGSVVLAHEIDVEMRCCCSRVCFDAGACPGMLPIQVPRGVVAVNYVYAVDCR